MFVMGKTQKVGGKMPAMDYELWDQIAVEPSLSINVVFNPGNHSRRIFPVYFINKKGDKLSRTRYFLVVNADESGELNRVKLIRPHKGKLELEELPLNHPATVQMLVAAFDRVSCCSGGVVFVKHGCIVYPCLEVSWLSYQAYLERMEKAAKKVRRAA